jgi:hypothetical protein
MPNRPGWETLLLTSEYTFQDTPFPTSVKPVVIAGKPDCVRLQSDGIVVVDYKLSRGANLKSDLFQVVIYAALLRATRPSLEFSTQLEYYEPELHLVSQSADEAIQLFEDQVRPVLEKIGTHQPGRRQPGAVGNRCWPR